MSTRDWPTMNAGENDWMVLEVVVGRQSAVEEARPGTSLVIVEVTVQALVFVVVFVVRLSWGWSSLICSTLSAYSKIADDVDGPGTPNPASQRSKARRPDHEELTDGLGAVSHMLVAFNDPCVIGEGPQKAPGPVPPLSRPPPLIIEFFWYKYSTVT